MKRSTHLMSLLTLLALLASLFIPGLAAGELQSGAILTVSRAETASSKAGLQATASKTVKAGIGKKVSFTAAVSGQTGKVSYQWQESTNGKKWKSSKETGAKTKKLTMTVSEETFARQYRCVVKDGAGKAISNVVAVEMPFTITVTPGNQTLDLGKKAKFTVKAAGTVGGVKFQWMVSENGGKTWKKSTLTGAKKKIFRPEVTNEVYGCLFRCEVTDKRGKLYSEIVYMEPEDSKDYSFQKQDDGWTITGYTGSKTALVLPAGHLGRKVTAVAAKAFQGKKTLKKITIPKTITHLGAYAFENCTGLKTVVLSDSIMEIGKACFRGCKALIDVEIVNR